ncbi:MAG: T9SS type A sorting domain-containing protein [Crocinitomix sp.]|nr:T9SS type A sorting domain-containing protein [Crocinitomix sp.]
MNTKFLLKTVLLFIVGFGMTNSWSQVTFDYTGGLQMYTVPGGVTLIEISTTGAIGGNEIGGGAVVSAPGNGAQMIGAFAVTPGEVLTLMVGEEGGSATYVGGGGGGTFVWNAADELLIAAGGGGGAGYTDIGGVAYFGLDASIDEDGVIGNGLPDGAGTGGNGGVVPTGFPDYGSGGAGWLSNGNNGTIYGCSSNSTGGQRPLDGGAGGTGGGSGASIAPGGYGGGGGGNARCGAVSGGGGGGYSGGGCGGEPITNGYNGAGGGGSFNDGADQVNTAGVGVGNGQIIITELCNIIDITASETEICFGDEVTLSGVAVSGEDVTWLDGVVDGVAFTPVDAGTITYTASTIDPEDCVTTIEIEVIAAPIVVPTIGGEEYCDGDVIVLGAGGNADEYSWDPEDFTPPVGVTTYTLTGTFDGSDCSTSETIDVTVYDLPSVSATADDDIICIGNSVTLNGTGAEDYVWDPADIEDGDSYTPMAVGTYTYTVTGTDENGCTDTDEIDITVAEEISITYTTTEEVAGDDGEIAIVITGGAPTFTFDWDNDGTGDFDDTQDLTGLSGGFYTIVVIGEAGCTATETMQLGSQVGINEIENSVNVYPNPTVDILNIQLEGNFTYSITSISGQILYNGSAINSTEVNLEELASGAYIVVLNQNDKTSIVQLVKQ